VSSFIYFVGLKLINTSLK